MKLVISNSRTEEMVGDLSKLSDRARAIGGWGAQRMLWFATDGDVVILPWLPPATYLEYVTGLTVSLSRRRNPAAHHATGGTTGGMTSKTTVYLPDNLKAQISREAQRRGIPEAEVIRVALAAGLQRPAPRGALFAAEPFASRANELLEGLGER